MTSMQLPPVAIVILNWNGAALLRRYLPTVVEHTLPHEGEVIVADNGSTDDSLDYCASLHVRTLSLGRNHGFAEGYNHSISALRHRYVLLLNNDVRVTPGWLSPLLRFMEAHPDVAAVQPKIRSERTPSHFEYAGAQGGYLDWLGYPFCRGRIFADVEEDHGQYGSEPQEIFWATGAALLARRDAYVEEGGLEPNFFAHQEEIDLCWRWRTAGYRLFVVPESEVYHVGGASLAAENPRKTFLNFRNNLRMLYRNLPHGKIPFTLICRFFLDALAATVFSLQGKPRDGWAVVKAWGSFVRHLPERSRRGRHELSYRSLYPHTLLFRYHIMRERTYSSLKK